MFYIMYYVDVHHMYVPVAYLTTENGGRCVAEHRSADAAPDTVDTQLQATARFIGTVAELDHDVSKHAIWNKMYKTSQLVSW